MWSGRQLVPANPKASACTLGDPPRGRGRRKLQLQRHFLVPCCSFVRLVRPILALENSPHLPVRFCRQLGLLLVAGSGHSMQHGLSARARVDSVQYQYFAYSMGL